ncbi:MAG: hypothetical protein P8017_14825 [Deltaproteobacteria bacterium]
MRMKTLTFLLCLAMAFLLSGQMTNAQDIIKVLTPGGQLTPEAQQALRQSQQFKTLTPEEIQRGKAELEKRESESRIEEQERIEKKKQQEEQGS